MNLILFEPDEIARPLGRNDPRARHIADVLRRGTGDSFDAGIVNGPRGKGTVVAMTADALELTFTWETTPAPPPPLRLIVGLPRPQTARDILRDATSLGVTGMDFVLTEKAEPGYARSTVWSSGEWRRRLLAGAEQAFSTWIPQVRHGQSLLEALATLPAGAMRLALDNYESAEPLGCSRIEPEASVVVAVGAERGWSAKERAILREHAFRFVHLGSRVLRTETAIVAALAIIRSRQGRM